MITFYIQGYTKQQVKDKLEKLRKHGYKIIGTSIGRFIGTSEYYGDIYYDKI